MPSRSPLVEAWFRGLPARHKREPWPDIDLTELIALLHDARQALPGVPFDDEGMLAHLARLSGTVFPDRTTFAALHLADLALAGAALAGAPEALARFDRDLWKDVVLAGEAEGRSAEELAGFRRDLFDAESPSSLLTYSGRGSLHAWLRVALLRRRSAARRAPMARERVSPEDVRALDVAKPALESAVKDLGPEERAILEGRASGDPARRSVEEALLLRTRRHLFSKGLERDKGEEALRVVWRGLGELLRPR